MIHTYLYSVCSIAHTATSSTSSSSLVTGEATISSSWAATLSSKILTKIVYIWPVYAVCCLLQGSLLSPGHGAHRHEGGGLELDVADRLRGQGGARGGGRHKELPLGSLRGLGLLVLGPQGQGENQR